MLYDSLVVGKSKGSKESFTRFFAAWNKKKEAAQHGYEAVTEEQDNPVAIAKNARLGQLFLHVAGYYFVPLFC